MVCYSKNKFFRDKIYFLGVFLSLLCMSSWTKTYGAAHQDREFNEFNAVISLPCPKYVIPAGSYNERDAYLLFLRFKYEETLVSVHSRAAYPTPYPFINDYLEKDEILLREEGHSLSCEDRSGEMNYREPVVDFIRQTASFFFKQRHTAPLFKDLSKKWLYRASRLRVFSSQLLLGIIWFEEAAEGGVLSAMYYLNFIAGNRVNNPYRSLLEDTDWGLYRVFQETVEKGNLLSIFQRGREEYEQNKFRESMPLLLEASKAGVVVADQLLCNLYRGAHKFYAIGGDTKITRIEEETDESGEVIERRFFGVPHWSETGETEDITSICRESGIVADESKLEYHSKRLKRYSFLDPSQKTEAERQRALLEVSFRDLMKEERIQRVFSNNAPREDIISFTRKWMLCLGIKEDLADINVEFIMFFAAKAYQDYCRVVMDMAWVSATSITKLLPDYMPEDSYLFIRGRYRLKKYGGRETEDDLKKEYWAKIRDHIRKVENIYRRYISLLYPQSGDFRFGLGFLKEDNSTVVLGENLSQENDFAEKGDIPWDIVDTGRQSKVLIYDSRPSRNPLPRLTLYEEVYKTIRGHGLFAGPLVGVFARNKCYGRSAVGKGIKERSY